MKGARVDDPIVPPDDNNIFLIQLMHGIIAELKSARTQINAVADVSVLETWSLSKCVFAENLEKPRCEIKRLSKFFESAKPDIKHNVCEMKRTFVTPGQRMYLSVPFTKKYLMDYISSPMKNMRIVFSTGSIEEGVSLLKGQDNRATITTNWFQFVKSAKISQGRICVFSFHTRKGKLWVNVHGI